MPNVYLNGEFIPVENAKISVLDRGFTFADSVYEIIPVFNRCIFHLDKHIERLNRSLQSIYMESPLELEEWRKIIDRLINENDASDQSVYLQVSRGISERDHAIDIANQPTIFVMSKSLKHVDRTGGISAITLEDIRWGYCHIKATTLLASVLLKHEAARRDATEAILIRQGLVTEGAASNVFIVYGGEVMTPVKNTHILPGITRDLLVDILNSNNIRCTECEIDAKLLKSADEIWITSSTWEIVPVIKLDGNRVGEGIPGKIYHIARQLYESSKQSLISSQAGQAGCKS